MIMAGYDSYGWLRWLWVAWFRRLRMAAMIMNGFDGSMACSCGG